MRPSRPVRSRTATSNISRHADPRCDLLHALRLSAVSLVARRDRTSPSLARHARHRMRRIMPAYVAAVLATFAVYTLFAPGPNPGQTWHGLLRHLTLTQVYTDNFLGDLSASGPVADVEPGSRSVVLRRVARAGIYLLLRRRADWRPVVTLRRPAALATITPVWLILANTTDLLRTRMWLPAHLGLLYRRHGIGGSRCSRRARASVTLPSAAALYLAVATPIGGVIVGADPAWVLVTKACLYAAIAALVVGTGCARPARSVHADPWRPADGVARRDLLRDVPSARGRDGGTS